MFDVRGDLGIGNPQKCELIPGQVLFTIYQTTMETVVDPSSYRRKQTIRNCV